MYAEHEGKDSSPSFWDMWAQDQLLPWSRKVQTSSTLDTSWLEPLSLLKVLQAPLEETSALILDAILFMEVTLLTLLKEKLDSGSLLKKFLNGTTIAQNGSTNNQLDKINWLKDK